MWNPEAHFLPLPTTNSQCNASRSLYPLTLPVFYCYNKMPDTGVIQGKQALAYKFGGGANTWLLIGKGKQGEP